MHGMVSSEGQEPHIDYIPVTCPHKMKAMFVTVMLTFSMVKSFRISFRPSTISVLRAAADTESPKNFITNLIDDDIESNKNGGRVVTRFPPEPNGYLHLGHAKSICLNFGLGKAYGGQTHMRFDDTNPAKEEMEYVQSILEDVKWIVNGKVDSPPPWYGDVRHASDYFEVTYQAAIFLIKNGKAYVDDLTPEQMKEYRGTLTETGKDSPYRSRTIDENLHLFEKMKIGEFQDGSCVLRAKIDMNSPNMNMRDPTLYRIKRASHPITGDKWLIYPMYDYAHAISDAYEGITHSLCTLEFADHRPLYDWVIDNLSSSGLLPFEENGWRPKQTEFSRLNLQYTVLSKRKLIQLVKDKHVNGWDDPRMPTICGVRRRGFPAEAIRLFCERVGISKAENNIDYSVLEECVREILEDKSPRALAVQNPLKVTISNWPQDKVEVFVAENHPKLEELGSREIPFSNSLFIDRDDFFDTGKDGTIAPPKGYKRLVSGGQVRLKYAYVITCDQVIRDPHSDRVIELICSYDERTRSGKSVEGLPKAKGIIQWVSEKHGINVDLQLYDRLFTAPSPGKDHIDGDFLKDINPDSFKLISTAVVEPHLGLNCKPGISYQFERLGYFCLDENNSNTNNAPKRVFNRVVTLKDTWQNNPTGQSLAAQLSTVNQKEKVVDDIRRMEFRVGQILECSRHPDADTLYVQKIDCGDSSGPRTIISGLAKYIPSEILQGRKVVVLCNLKPSKVRGILSEGMVLAASIVDSENESERVEVLEPPADAPTGELIQINGFDVPIPDVQLKNPKAIEAWKRVASQLKTNENCEATFGAIETQTFYTSTGPCRVLSLKNAPIK